MRFIDAHACDHQPPTTTPDVMNSEQPLGDNSEPSTIQDFLRKQSSDPFCEVASRSVGQPNSDFSIDQHGLLVCRSLVDGSIQTVAPQSLRRKVL